MQQVDPNYDVLIAICIMTSVSFKLILVPNRSYSVVLGSL